jgi:hypothetical protein
MACREKKGKLCEQISLLLLASRKQNTVLWCNYLFHSFSIHLLSLLTSQPMLSRFHQKILAQRETSSCKFPSRLVNYGRWQKISKKGKGNSRLYVIFHVKSTELKTMRKYESMTANNSNHNTGTYPPSLDPFLLSSLSAMECGE